MKLHFHFFCFVAIMDIWRMVMPRLLRPAVTPNCTGLGPRIIVLYFWIYLMSKKTAYYEKVYNSLVFNWCSLRISFKFTLFVHKKYISRNSVPILKIFQGYIPLTFPSVPGLLTWHVRVGLTVWGLRLMENSPHKHFGTHSEKFEEQVIKKKNGF